MALPQLSSEEREAALAKAAIARQKRAELKRDIKDRVLSLSQVLEMANEDPIVAKLRVSALLASLPGIGTAKSQKIMEEIGISPSRRVGGLGPHQREALIKIFG